VWEEGVARADVREECEIWIGDAVAMYKDAVALEYTVSFG
jgi:hypothetical protein